MINTKNMAAYKEDVAAVSPTTLVGNYEQISNDEKGQIINDAVEIPIIRGIKFLPPDEISWGISHKLVGLKTHTVVSSL